MKKKLLIGLATGMFLCGMAGAASATLYMDDFIYANDGGITHDDATGLEWLDLGLTSNRSYNRVTSWITGTGPFAGFRYATLNELIVLFDHANIVNHNGDIQPLGPVSDLKNLWGGGLVSDTVGFITGEQAAPTEHYLGALYSASNNGWVQLTGQAWSDERTSMALGSALVRNHTPTPEPATMLLFGTGLAGLAGTSIRRKKKG